MMTKITHVFSNPLLFAFVIAAAILSAFIVEVNAAPVNGEEFSFRQPDGSQVPVRVWGDEFYVELESLDGYTLIRGSDGWIGVCPLYCTPLRLSRCS
ncbi:MAG: hypothetical protein LBI42_00285 [Chitinispirillales bacterium]|jgi:hypothetical protein|nr:hypothetical protein [Chitinispirillales bacterium]